jgi:6-pyruvoyltetrahydropterin/6-carboxytetrahydropterin synthase
VLAHWIWVRLKSTLTELVRVVVCETCEARCEYDGD